MMIFHEPEVRNDITKCFPTGEISSFNDQPIKFAVLFNNRINLTGYRFEIFFREWTVRFDHAKVFV